MKKKEPSLVSQAIEHLRLSFNDDVMIAHMHECSIFDLFNRMSPTEMAVYRKRAEKFM